MKASQILKYNLLVALMLLSTMGSAKLQEEKTKKVNKSYNVKKDVELSITNQFGKVHVNSWDKSEFKVDVEMIARGKNEERAQKILDKIAVEIEESSSEIAFETAFASGMNSKNEESFEVNYTVYAPSGNPLDVENKFGDTYIASRRGSTVLEVSYGNLKADDLTGKLDLSLSFGNGTVGETGNSEVEVKYSNLEIESGQQMDMEQGFSEVKLLKIYNLELESKYGSVEIGQAGKVVADAEYSGLTVDELLESIYLEASYISDFEIDKLSKSFIKVEINGKFSNYIINLEAGTKADLEAEFSFADLKNSHESLDLYYKVKESHKSEYKGRIGGGDPSRKIIVRSSYGDLRLR